MKRSIIICCVALVLGGGLFAEGDEKATLTVDEARGLYSLLENIKEQKSLFPEEIDARALVDLLDEIYIEGGVSVSEDDSELVLPGPVFLTTYRKSQVIQIDSFFTPKADAAEADCIRLVNDWNKDNIFPTVVWTGEHFAVQYFLTFAGGIHKDNFNETLKWYYAMWYGFSDFLEKHGLAE